MATVDTKFELGHLQHVPCNWDTSDDSGSNFGLSQPHTNGRLSSALWTMPQTAREIGRAEVALLWDARHAQPNTAGAVVEQDNTAEKWKDLLSDGQHLVEHQKSSSSSNQISANRESQTSLKDMLADKLLGEEDEDHVPIWKGPFGMLQGRFGDLNAVRNSQLRKEAFALPSRVTANTESKGVSPRHSRLTKEEPSSGLSECEGCGYDMDTVSGSSLDSAVHKEEGVSNAWIEKLSSENIALNLKIRRMEDADCNQRAKIASLESKIEALESKMAGGGTDGAMDVINKRNEELTKQVTQLKVYVKSKEKQILTYRDELTKVYGRFPGCTGQTISSGVRGCGWQTRFHLEPTPPRIGATGRQPSAIPNPKLLPPRQQQPRGGRPCGRSTASQTALRKPKEVLCVNKKTGQVECKDTVPEYSHRRRRGV
ncbi:hypothetical protein BSKO_03433 [Bryopsis sp. KO-2023]|nr:hypothetical protein BSKO_03433 [Bryopsis sp. KO-2023]